MAAMRPEKWRLADLSKATTIRVSTLGNYCTGVRLMKPWDAMTIAKALGIRAAYLLCLEDSQFLATAEEERLIRNWRALPENAREKFASKIETDAIPYRSDAIPDGKLEHLSAAGKKPVAKVARKLS